MIAKGVRNSKIPVCITYNMKPLSTSTYGNSKGIKYPYIYVGNFSLQRRLYYMGNWRISRMMLLSYSGIALCSLPFTIARPYFSRYHAINHRFGELEMTHNDVEERNMLYNPEDGQAMILDFELSNIFPRAKISRKRRARSALPNGKHSIGMKRLH